MDYTNKKTLNNRKMKKLREKLIKKLEPNHGYSLLKSCKTLKETEADLALADQVDNIGYISEELGQELENLLNEDDYIIGIHRTGYTDVTNETLNDIFNNGLINNGHIGYGANDGTKDIEKTVSLFYNLPFLIHQLKAASGYKNSQGCVIIKIPKSYIGKKQGERKPIYYEDQGISMLLPEFIYGYVPVEGYNVGDIIRNSNYKDIHDYKNNDLLYDEKVYFKIRKEYLETYNIIKQAYIDTYLKYGERQATHALLSLINNKDSRYFTGKFNRTNLLSIPNEEILNALRFGSNTQSSEFNEIMFNFQRDCSVNTKPKENGSNLTR